MSAVILLSLTIVSLLDFVWSLPLACPGCWSQFKWPHQLQSMIYKRLLGRDADHRGGTGICLLWWRCRLCNCFTGYSRGGRWKQQVLNPDRLVLIILCQHSTISILLRCFLHWQLDTTFWSNTLMKLLEVFLNINSWAVVVCRLVEFNFAIVDIGINQNATLRVLYNCATLRIL